MLYMSLRVGREKAMMVLHLRSLEEETLAFRVYKEQHEGKWPGLAGETKLFCEELGIEDCNTTSMNKCKYRQLLTQACHEKNIQILRATATEVKCGRIKTEEYGAAVYSKNTTIEETRKWFRSRYKLQEFAGNYANDRSRFAKTDWLCRCKLSTEDEDHIVSGQCPVYGGLRTQCGDLGEDRNLVAFFKAILDMRDKLEEEDRRQQS